MSFPASKPKRTERIGLRVWLWLLLAACFAALVIGFGLSYGHKLAQRQTRLLDFVRSYEAMNSAAPRTVRIVRIVLAR